MRDIMNECGSECSTSFLWFYVVSYHILTNIIFLNLFVAVLLENYELGVAADNFDITKDFCSRSDQDPVTYLRVPIPSLFSGST